MSTVSTINFVNDLGYGSIKGNLDGKNIHIPSVAASENEFMKLNPAHFSKKADEQKYVKALLNNLDVYVKSSALHHNGRYLIGKNAITSGLPLRTFDVASCRDKSLDDLSFILTLGVLGGFALQKYYHAHHKIPYQSGLHVNINMATALPILEGMKGGHYQRTKIYKKRYILYDHEVDIYNFGHPVKVRIHFNSTNTFVFLEGEVAHYAVKYAKANTPKLIHSMRADFIHHYPNLAKGAPIGEIDNILTFQDPSKVTVGVDIGEGTTDFDVFTPNGDNGSKLNSTMSKSIPDGYGDVLNKALDYLHRHGHNNIRSRMQLKRILRSKSILDRPYKKPVVDAINKYKPTLASRIISALATIIRNAPSTRIIYVYGGGSIPMRDMREAIENETKQNTDNIGIPVMFINPQYAQGMNKLGLMLILNTFTSHKR